MQPKKIVIPRNQKFDFFTLKILKDFSYTNMEFDMQIGLKYLEFYENMNEIMDVANIKGLIEDNFGENNLSASLMKDIEKKIQSKSEMNLQ